MLVDDAVQQDKRFKQTKVLACHSSETLTCADLLCTLACRACDAGGKQHTCTAVRDPAAGQQSLGPRSLCQVALPDAPAEVISILPTVELMDLIAEALHKTDRHVLAAALPSPHIRVIMMF